MKRLLFALVLSLPLAARADITTGLVGWWKLDEPSGTTASDASGNGYHGTYTNSPTLNQTGAFGSSKAVAFAKASSQYVATAGLTTGSTNTVTIALWIKPNGTQDAWAGLVYSRGATVNGLHWWSSAGRQLAYTWNADAATYGWSSGVILADGAWSHVALVISATNAKLYVNGSLAATNTVTHAALTNPFGSLQLARDSFGTRYSNASLDDVRIYSRALAANDVAELVNSAAYTPAVGDNYANSIDNLIHPGAPVGNVLDLFTSFTLAADTSVYNGNLWGSGGALVNWTSIGHVSSPTTTYYAKWTAITKRHALQTQHSMAGATVGDKIMWIAANGTRVERTVTGERVTVGGTTEYDSFHLVYLNADLPASINIAPVFADKSLSLVGYPVVKTDQYHRATIADVTTDSHTSVAFVDSGTGNRGTYYADWVGGDSASPAFVLVGAQPIYLTSGVYGTGGSGPPVASVIGNIDQACRDLDSAATGYLPTYYGIGNTAARRAATNRSLNP